MKLPDFNENNVLFAILLGYIAIQAVFLPHMYASIDEHEYIKNSVLMRDSIIAGNPSIAVADPGLACRSTIQSSEGYISSQYPGESMYLIPFTFFGLDGILVSQLILRIIGFALVILILQRLGTSPYYSILYLFYPALVFFSRTLFPQVIVLTCALAGLYFFLGRSGKDHVLSGLFFGLAVVSRYDALLIFLAFLLPSAIFDRKKALLMASGAAPLGLFILLFNSHFYSGALNSGYGSASYFLNFILREFVKTETWIETGIFTLILMCVYPLMLLSPFKAKKFQLRLEFFLLSLFLLVFNSIFVIFSDFSLSFETLLTARLRLLLPLIGLLVIPYASMLSELVQTHKIKIPRIVLAIAILLMLGGSAFLSAKHSGLLDTRSRILDQIYSHTPAGSTIIGSADDCIYFLPKVFEERKYYSVFPEYELAGQSFDLQSLKGQNTFVLDLNYYYLSERDTNRQLAIDRERQRMSDFIEKNRQDLNLVYSAPQPDNLNIYSFK